MEVRLEAGEGTHVVDFYADDRALMARVAGHLLPALRDHGTAIAICTPGHRRLLVDTLADSGCGVERAIGEGALLLLDAAETLERFARERRPDPGPFDAIVGQLLRDRSAAERPLRVFGEMVALLWDEGKVAEAIELETSWNEVASQVRFDLYCAYRSELVGHRQHADQVAEVCALHSSVLSRQDVPGAVAAAPETRTFPAEVRSSARARAFVRQALADYSPRLVEDVVMAASELAANAVVHGRSEFVVTVDRSPDGIRLSVGDTGPGEPSLRSAERLDSSGRGLHLVDLVASRWGIERQGASKVVWAYFELAATAAA